MAFELSATPEHDALLNLMFEPGDLDNLMTPDEPEFNRTRNPIDHTQEDTMKEAHSQIQVPVHPIATMQEAFAESMLEASGGNTPSIPKNAIGNASARRKHLLDQDINEPTHAARWQSKPGLRYHELWKLMAQISFGIYLLLNGIARDDEQVMNILQGHVDEVDEFLETTLEDFDLAQQDVDERLKFLKLPLENIAIFDAMLEDRNFRLQIVNGNERIEHVITRTATAMNDALKDVTQGLDACKEFTFYLAEEQEDRIWREERPEMLKVFDAMKGNVEGWYKAYVSLQTKGNHLGVGLVQLGSIVAEMDRRAGEVSRRKRFSVPQSTAPPRTSSPPSSPVRQSRQMRQSMLKNLPEDPSAITPAIRATLPAFQLVQDRDRSPERQVHVTDDDSLAELEAPEEEFILKPRTYTPVPSPRVPPPRTQTPPPAPEVTKKPSLRQRFSLKRKESPSASKESSQEKAESHWGPRQRIQPPPSRPNDRTVNTPPSRGLDSAYCSDFEKTSPSRFVPPHTLQPTRSHTSSDSAARSTRTQPLPQRTFGEVLPSPRSERQQYFHPVNASPHSPLQRPWTAAPREISHIHSNSSTSNLSTLRGQQHTSSTYGNRRGAPSAMGMSMASGKTQMTTVLDADGKQQKVKKKRSAFGWLKKAFSLSEEEKAAFEEKRKRTDHTTDAYRKDYYQKPAPRWIDGKKVRSSASQRQVVI